MASIGPYDSEEFQIAEAVFWRTVRETCRNILTTNTFPVEEYRDSLLEGSLDQRLLAMHDDPLELASTLTGVRVTPPMISEYKALSSKIYSDRAAHFIAGDSDLAPRRLHDPARRPELPQRRRDERAETYEAIRASDLAKLMDRFGYVSAGQEGIVAFWRKKTYVGYPWLPDVFTTLALPRDDAGRTLVPAFSVLQFYDTIIGLAAQSEVSPTLVASLRKERDEFLRHLRQRQPPDR
jgi:hypothetical protein